MIVFESNGKSYATAEAASEANPGVTSVEGILLDGVSRRELGTGEIIDVSQDELDIADADRASEAADYSDNAWLRWRQADYLPMAEQLDMIYWDMKNGTSTFTDHRDAVKAAHPKPV